MYVLDASDGCGRRAWLIHKQLMARLEQTPGLAGRCRYIIFSSHADELEPIERHPYFAAQIRSGRVDTALWDIEQGERCRLRHGAAALGPMRNPPVVLAHDLLGRLSRELYSLHYGKIFSTRMRYIGPGRLRAPSIAYEWLPEALADLPSAQMKLLRHYLGCVNSVQLMMPTGALRASDHLANLCCGRYLLLARGSGSAHLRQMHAVAEPLPARPAELGRAARRINYHVLARYLREEGCQVWHAQTGQAPVLTLALGPGESGATFSALPQLAALLSAADLVDNGWLAKSSDAWSIPQVLCLLRQARFDPAVFHVLFPVLDGKLTRNDDDWPHDWRQALSALWGQCFQGEPGAPLLIRRLVALAMRIGYWGLAREMLENLHQWYGGAAGDAYLLACCEAQTGRLTQALAYLLRARALAPECGHYSQAHAALERRQQERRGRAGAVLDGIADGELVLELLGPEHAPAFLHHYRDAQIGVMAGLPPMGTEAEVRSWIDSKALAPGRAMFAVMHRDWGFVGMTALDFAAATGLFYFWIGSDFQGQGVGKRAAALLCDKASVLGVKQLFTTVFEDNARSRAALLRSGFRPMTRRANAPYDALLFYRRCASDVDESLTIEHIAAFCRVFPVEFDFGTEQTASGEAVAA
ncbi:GNAT family N-acetyltransferase [Rugamonas aquatica]|uniref:GNAT family N-acetyltransferase n=1 Tax=Rugamonas aquatica TaxID=2743357 RepID=UPI0015818F5F|nr:GNAT family N-acetyltransferase [Rugamonas aquatica]